MNSDFDKRFERERSRFDKTWNFAFKFVIGLLLIKAVIVIVEVLYLLVEGPEIIDRVLDILSTFAAK